MEWYEFDLTNVVPVNYLEPRGKMLVLDPRTATCCYAALPLEL